MTNIIQPWQQPDCKCSICKSMFYEEQIFEHEATGDKVCEGCVEDHIAMETVCAEAEGERPNLKYYNLRDQGLYESDRR